MTTRESDEFLTVYEMAADIKASAKHIRREIEKGNLPVYRFGRLVRASRADWVDYKTRRRG